jgi:hypothetical protein
MKHKRRNACAIAKKHYCNNINRPGATNLAGNPSHRCVSDSDPEDE